MMSKNIENKNRLTLLSHSIQNVHFTKFALASSDGVISNFKDALPFGLCEMEISSMYIARSISISSSGIPAIVEEEVD